MSKFPTVIRMPAKKTNPFMLSQIKGNGMGQLRIVAIVNVVVGKVMDKRRAVARFDGSTNYSPDVSNKCVT